MQLLITGGNGHFARAVGVALSSTMNVRLFDAEFSAPLPVGIATLRGDLRDPDAVAAAVAGVDAIIHLAPLAVLPGMDEVTALDLATRGSYVLMKAANAAQIERIILGSTLALFDQMPAHWKIDEDWRPQPTPELDQLCPWLAELSVRQSARVGNMQAICLRFGQIVDDAMISGQAYDPRWLHIADAIRGVRQALNYTVERRPAWSIFHITAPGAQAKIRMMYQKSGQEKFGYQPTHHFDQHAARTEPVSARDQRPWREILAASQPMPSRPIRKVVIFGAGGPMGAVTTQEISSSYTLRVTDIRSMAEIAAANQPQAPGAPLPIPLTAPHEERLVDVRDLQQVMDACEGMDAIINTTVVRPHPVDAFLVNTIGAYNVMRAAIQHKIRRVVHTGPLVQQRTGARDYQWDYDLHVDAPARAFDQLYIHSKYLGQEICRVFAEHYALEVPVLLFYLLFNPDVVKTEVAQFTISWADTGRALRRALEVMTLPSPYEMMNICADLPLRRFDHDKARKLLNWQPRDGLESYWQD